MVDARTAPRSWDFFLTVFMLFVLLVLTGIFVFLGFGLGVTTLPCADSAIRCNYSLISIGALVVVIGTPVVALVGFILSVVRILRRKLSFAIPLVASLLSVGVFLLGAYLVDLAVPGN